MWVSMITSYDNCQACAQYTVLYDTVTIVAVLTKGFAQCQCYNYAVYFAMKTV
jgi:hypothetical protein